MQFGGHSEAFVATIGYERATIDEVVRALAGAGVELVVDVRAVTSSRRPGFSRNRLAAHLIGSGIYYLHLRGLGTPADGRAAARAGRHAEMRRIFAEHLRTLEARNDLDTLADLVATGRRVCLLCFEADPAHCHRTQVADALGAVVLPQSLTGRIRSARLAGTAQAISPTSTITADTSASDRTSALT
jgi:uncharacterized protein (DUF488 family)